MTSGESVDELLKQVVAEIRCGAAVGSGFFIGPGILLTCAHVVPGDECSVRWGGESRAGRVHRRFPEELPVGGGLYPLPDLAVVVLEGASFTLQPCAELDFGPVEAIERGTELRSVGLTERYAAGRSVHDLGSYSYAGVIPYEGFVLLQVRAETVVPGMSGAPVLDPRTGRVCAVVKRSADTRVAQGGWLFPLAQLAGELEPFALPDRRWRDARRRTLFPGLGNFLRRPKGPGRGVVEGARGYSDLLRPELGVVPFHGRDDWLADMVRWCERGRYGVDVRLVTGPAGTGKTRAALALVDNRHDAGWVSGLLDRADLRAPDALDDRLGRLAALEEPALVVVDYAEDFPRLGELLNAAVRHFRDRPAPLRVLLLARRSEDWWPAVLGDEIDDHGFAERLRGGVQRLAALAVHHDPERNRGAQQEEFTLSVRAFARHLREPVPGARLDVAPGDRPPLLQIHTAALLAVVATAEGDRHRIMDGAGLGAVTADVEVIDALLDRERWRFWRRSAKRVLQHPVGLDLPDRAVALATFGGADDLPAARALIAGVLEYPAPQDREIAEWLAGLYPPYAVDASEYWASLRPDLIGERHVAKTFGADPARPEAAGFALASGALDLLPDHRRQRAFTVLARALQHSSAEVEPLLRRLLMDDRARAERIPLAVRLAPLVGGKLVDVLKELLVEAGDDSLFHLVADALPEASVELTPITTLVLTRIPEKQLDPQTLVALGSHLLVTGEPVVALGHIRQGTRRLEELERGEPGGRWSQRLRDAYVALSAALAETGMAREAVTAGRKAIEWGRIGDEPRSAALQGLIATAEALMLNGSIKEAHALIDRSVAEARAIPEDEEGRSTFRALTLASKAMILLAQGHVHQALSIADSGYRALMEDEDVAGHRDVYALAFAPVLTARALAAWVAEDTPVAEVEHRMDHAIELLRWMYRREHMMVVPPLVLLLVARAQMAQQAGDEEAARNLGSQAAVMAVQQVDAGYRRAGLVLLHVLDSLRAQGVPLPDRLMKMLPDAAQLRAARSARDGWAAIGELWGEQLRDRFPGTESSQGHRFLVLYEDASRLATEDRPRAIAAAREALALLASEDDPVEMPNHESDLLGWLSRWSIADDRHTRDELRTALRYAREATGLRQGTFSSDPGPVTLLALLRDFEQTVAVEQELGETEAARRTIDRAVRAATGTVMERAPAQVLPTALRIMLRQATLLHESGAPVPALGVLERTDAYLRRFPGVVAGAAPALITTLVKQHTGLLEELGRPPGVSISYTEETIRREFMGPEEGEGTGAGIREGEGIGEGEGEGIGEGGGEGKGWRVVAGAQALVLAHADALWHLALLRRRHDDPEGALADLDAGVELCADDPELSTARATLLRHKGLTLLEVMRPEEAIGPLTEALELFRGVPGDERAGEQPLLVIGELGRALRGSGRHREALERFGELLDGAGGRVEAVGASGGSGGSGGSSGASDAVARHLATWCIERSFVWSGLGEYGNALADAVSAEEEYRARLRAARAAGPTAPNRQDDPAAGLGSALVAKALHLLAVARLDEAVDAAEEAELIALTLLDEDPDAYASWAVYAARVRAVIRWVRVPRAAGELPERDPEWARFEALRKRYEKKKEWNAFFLQKALDTYNSRDYDPD
ncbi:trypsin-like peptidase domain-containing protein [Streptomyces sp. NPDC093252]|uniref:trypsin-like peptidase domain-containing protein n=1 Tax=Streptomyces sp. NPDC093252 TaxID=3154980 RepID=UPI003423BBA6